MYVFDIFTLFSAETPKIPCFKFINPTEITGLPVRISYFPTESK